MSVLHYINCQETLVNTTESFIQIDLPLSSYNLTKFVGKAYDKHKRARTVQWFAAD